MIRGIFSACVAAALCAALASSASTAALGAAVVLDAPGHAAVEGAAVKARGGEPGAAWTLIDWRGLPTGVGGIFGEDGTAELPPLPAGYYRMVAGETPASDSKPTTATLATLAVVTPPSLVTRHSSLP